MNPIVEEAVSDLSMAVNKSTGLAHPSDKTRAYWTFYHLRENGIYYDPDEIFSFLTRYGEWNAERAAEVKEVAAKVSEGRRLKVYNDPFVPEIIEIWKKRSIEKRNR